MAEGGHNRGRAVSWLAVVIIIGGFTLGGLALILGTWWLFWVSFGIVAVGGILAVAIDIFADVQLDPLHQADADPHVSPIKHEVTRSADTSAELTPKIPGDAPEVDASQPIEDAGEPAGRDSGATTA